MYERFQERGYPKKWLRKAYWKAKLSNREELLRDGEGRSTENKKEIQLSERQPKRCIGTYDGYTKEVNQILKRHWSILTTDMDLIEVLPKYLSVNYRRGQNLRDILVHSNLQVDKPNTWLKSPTIGSYPCGSCTFCKYLPKIKEFKNPNDGHIYKLKQFINCKTRGIIYIASCNCPKLYVGKIIFSLGDLANNM